MSRTLWYNGNILTQDSKHPQVTAMLVDGDTIIDVGNDLVSKCGSDVNLFDLKGRYIIPGYHDAHIHIWKVGNLLTNMLDLRGVGSVEEMQQMLSDYANAHPELSWIQARGFNEADFPDKRMPDKRDLDAVLTNRPIVVTRTCAHQVIANSKALEIAGLDKHTPAVSGGEISYLSDGTLAGHFTETAIGLVLKAIPRYTSDELRSMVLTAQDVFLHAGITAACDPAVDRDLLEVYKQMDAMGELNVRINAIPIRVPDGSNKTYPNPDHYRSAYLSVNTVKFFADGGLSGKTAALRQPYLNDATFGVMRLQYETFLALARESHDAGFKIATHAIGDAAIDMVLRVYDQLPNNNISHRLEHVGLPDHEHLAIMQRRNISAVMQPVFIRELGKNFLTALDTERLEKLYPIKTIYENGINVALSTDAPVVRAIDPSMNMLDAMTRRTEEGVLIGQSEAITLEEARYMYTYGSAEATGQENGMGSITVGKKADFLVMESAQSLEPQEVWVGGKKQYSKN